MTEFPNYLMSANDNNNVARYQHKNQSSVAFHYKIEKAHVLPRKEPEIIKMSIMNDPITRRPFQPTTVPSLLQGVQVENRTNYDDIVKQLTRLDEDIILCDTNRVCLDKQLTQISRDTVFNAKTLQKKSGLNQSMANILLNETQQVNYLNHRNRESE